MVLSAIISISKFKDYEKNKSRREFENIEFATSLEDKV